MLDSFANYFWAHPVAIAAGAIAVIIILIWMTGSGSRQRFIAFKRTKETDQLARDLNRIAAALERIARSRETPMDYVGRPIPAGWEDSISAGEPSEETPSDAPATANAETVAAAMASESRRDSAQREAAASSAGHSAGGNAARPAPAPAARENQPASLTNPLGGTADLLGKKKLDLPNPLYRPK